MSKLEDVAAIFGLRKIRIEEKDGRSAEVEVINAQRSLDPCPRCAGRDVAVGNMQVFCPDCGMLARWDMPEQRISRRQLTALDELRRELFFFFFLPLLGLFMVACLLMINF